MEIVLTKQMPLPGSALLLRQLLEPALTEITGIKYSRHPLSSMLTQCLVSDEQNRDFASVAQLEEPAPAVEHLRVHGGLLVVDRAKPRGPAILEHGEMVDALLGRAKPSVKRRK
jgi:hypothetical protein